MDRRRFITESAADLVFNTGDAPLDLSNWRVHREDRTRYTFPEGFVLNPAGTATLYAGRGTDTESELYRVEPAKSGTTAQIP